MVGSWSWTTEVGVAGFCEGEALGREPRSRRSLTGTILLAENLLTGHLPLDTKDIIIVTILAFDVRLDHFISDVAATPRKF